MSSHFGIDLLFETQKGKINSENDVLIIVIHWILCKNNFRSVGIGDNKIYSDEDRPTELLPEGWNADQTTYTLRYELNKTIFILYGIVSDATLILNLLDGKTLKTSSLVLLPKEVIKAKTGVTIDDFVNDSHTVIGRIENEMVKPLSEPEKATTAGPSRDNDPLLIRTVQPAIPRIYQDPTRDPFRYPDPLRDIGRGDLDPFGRGGGMIFQPDFRPEFAPQPLNPLRYPPPGARFDPPNPLRRHDPDNDHMRPPPGYDDMFM